MNTDVQDQPSPSLSRSESPPTESDQTQSESLGAQELVALGDAVGQIVMSVKEFSHPGDDDAAQGESRRVSLREIAAGMGVSHTTVNKVASTLPSRQDEGKAGRSGYRYTLANAVDVRNAVIALPEIQKEMRKKERLQQLDRRRSAGEPCITLGIMNFKGGVAKSTTTAHLAGYLALHGYRVLAIDTDPQATLSTLFGIHPDIELDADDTLVPYFEGVESSLNYCIRKTEIPTLDVIPANVGLAQADLLLPARQRDERAAGNKWYYMTILAEGIKTVEENYDVVLIDCPPSMSYLTTVSTQACDALLVPMRPSMPDFASSAQFIRMFGGFQDQVDSVLNRTKRYDWLKVLITLGENNKTSLQMEKIIRKAYGDRVMTQKFPYLTAVATAAKRMRTLYDVSRADIEGRQLTKAMNIVDELCVAVEQMILLTRDRLSAAAVAGAQMEGEAA